MVKMPMQCEGIWGNLQSQANNCNNTVYITFALSLQTIPFPSFANIYFKWHLKSVATLNNYTHTLQGTKHRKLSLIS